MKHKGCYVFLLVLLILAALFLILGEHIRNQMNPVYHGKRLSEWADEAIESEDRAIRQRSVEVLREACDREEEETRLQLYYHLVGARGGLTHGEELPAELVPFLLERFAKEDQAAGMVAASLQRCPASQTVPGLIALLREEKGVYKRSQLIQTLGWFGPRAEAAIPLIRASLEDVNQEVRGTSHSALNKIIPENRKVR